MSKNLFLFIALIVLSNCQGNVAHKIIVGIDSKCLSNDNCIVSLRDIVDFDWDKLYFFNSWTTADSIRNTIGMNYSGSDVKDDYKRMIFIKGGDIVHEEDYKSFDYNVSTIDFPDIPDSLARTNHIFITPNSALFFVKKFKKECANKNCFDYRFYQKNN